MESKGQADRSKQVKQTEHPEVNKMLKLWVAKAMADNVPVNREILWQKWTHFANLVGVSEDERLNLSEEWLTAFKKQCGLKEFRCHGEAESSDSANVEKEQAQICELIMKHKYHLRDIFNMDKTGLFYV